MPKAMHPVSEEVSQRIARTAVELVKSYGSAPAWRTGEFVGPWIQYKSVPEPPPGFSDCSTFVQTVLRHAGLAITVDFSTASFKAIGSKEKDTYTTEQQWLRLMFQEVGAERARAGDIILQGSHMGIYLGTKDHRGRFEGAQMGTSGARVGKWSERSGGWFGKAKLRFYRPRTPAER